MGSRLDTNSSAVRKTIEKHKFDNEEGGEYSSSRFGGFTDYFRRKKIKLQNLDEELRSSSSNNPPIFRGVVAHINGYTQPSLNDLHTLIVSYGGGFLQYLDGKTAATHIVASNLTPKKRVEFRTYRIVKPAWVVDSVKAGKLLPWDGYKVITGGVGQNLLAFDNRDLVSQTNSQELGYRDQAYHSWYTKQVNTLAHKLDVYADEHAFPNAQVQSSSGNNNDHAYQILLEQEEHPQKPGPSSSNMASLSSDMCDTQDIEGASARRQAVHADALRITPGRALDISPSGLSGGDSSIGDSSISLSQKQIVRSPLNLVDSLEEPILEGVTDDSPAIDRSPQHFDGDGMRAIVNSPEMTAEDHNASLLADPKIWKSTVVNPGFLKQYYEESRLHHLSTWKADLKSQLQALAAEKSSSQKHREKRITGSRRYILHVDFDSFFAAVSLKRFPHYVDLPVVIAHGGGSGSEIASCNYPARKFGVKNGMWMKSAQKLCPNLKVLPYDFKAYEEASRNFYAAILDTGGIVQSVSVDEALIDVSTICIAAGGYSGTGIQEGSIWREQAKADEIARDLRQKIKEKSGCAVSVGIGGNILLAKVALRKAKPAGLYHVRPEEALDFLGGLLVQDLPGVAYSIGGKLEDIGVRFVKDVRELSKERLMLTLGPKTGEKIWNYSRGIDNAEVGQQVARKSVSAEVNWGIRFVTQEQVDVFIQSLCEELHKRLVNENVKGQQLQLKVMRRAVDAPLDPPKHLGHGKCDKFNKSIILGVATNEKDVLAREATSIMRGWGFSPGELRGIGIQMTRLESLKGTSESSSFDSQGRLQFKILNSPKASRQKHEFLDEVNTPQWVRGPLPNLASSLAADISPSGKRRPWLNTLGTQFILPTQADPEVLAELPEDIRSKILPQKPTNVLLFPPNTEVATSKSQLSSPALPSAALPDALPARSQLDQETLDALPSDVRAEILAFYKTSPEKPLAMSVLRSPRKISPTRRAPKKTTTPTKKRTAVISRSKVLFKVTPGPALIQSSFVGRHAPDRQNDELSASSEISPEFLSALPEDIRREVLDQARRDRLKKRGGIDLNIDRKPNGTNDPHVEAPPPGQQFLHLPPRPPKPTFTAQKVSALPALRQTVSAWFEEFRIEGPYADDVDSLVGYLMKVVDDEGDMNKAVSVVKWMEWLIGEAEREAGVAGKCPAVNQWGEALSKLQRGIQEAVKGRGLGRILF